MKKCIAIILAAMLTFALFSGTAFALNADVYYEAIDAETGRIYWNNLTSDGWDGDPFSTRVDDVEVNGGAVDNSYNTIAAPTPGSHQVTFVDVIDAMVLGPYTITVPDLSTPECTHDALLAGIADGSIGEAQALEPKTPATCTEPAKATFHCDVCGQDIPDLSYGSPLGHTWERNGFDINDPANQTEANGWVVDTAATTEAPGSGHYECTDCGEPSSAVEIPQLEQETHVHTWAREGFNADDKTEANGWVEDTAATCVAEGSGHWICTDEACDEPGAQSEPVATPIDPENHAGPIVDVPEVPATCTKAGTTAGTQCEACGTVIEAGTEIPAKGHTFEREGFLLEQPATNPNESNPDIGWVVDTPATAEQPGVGHYTCTDPACDAPDARSADVTITLYPGHGPEVPHVPTTTEPLATRAATCTEPAFEQYKCELCGQYYWVQVEGSAPLGHEVPKNADGTVNTDYLVKSDGSAPTCTEDGMNYYFRCNRDTCEFYYGQFTAAGEPTRDATTEEEFIKEHIAALGHILTQEQYDAAAGKVPPETDLQGQLLEPFSKDIHPDEDFAGNCQVDGYHREWCYRCKQYVTLWSTPGTHTWSEDTKDFASAKPATCWERGIAGSFHYCTVCGIPNPDEVKGDSQNGHYIDQLDHEDFLRGLTRATTGFGGIFTVHPTDQNADGTWNYAIDGLEANVANSLIPGPGEHKLSEVTSNYDLEHYGEVYYTYTPATCEEQGLFEWHCEQETCPYHAAQSVTLSPYGHVWVDTTKDANDGTANNPKYHDCTKPYQHLYQCSRCGKTKTEAADVHDAHEFTVLVGYHQTQPVNRSIRIGYVLDVDVDANPDIPYVVNYDGTNSLAESNFYNGNTAWKRDWNTIICEGLDYNKVMKCVDCDVYEEQPVAGDASKHVLTDEDWIVHQPASCTAPGLDIGYCHVCQTTVYEETPLAPHNWSYTVDVKATCTTEGHRVGTCTVCGATKEETIPPTGHNYVQTGEKLKDCLNGVDGYIEYTCEWCGDQYRVTIPGVHEYVWESGANVKPTCTNQGLYENAHCAICGHRAKNVPIPAYGHLNEPANTWPDDDPIKVQLEQDRADGKRLQYFYNGMYWDEKKPADCLHNTTYTFNCPECNQTITAEELGTITPNDHAMFNVDRTKPIVEQNFVIVSDTLTCGGQPNVLVRYNCGICGKPVEAELPPIPHNYQVTFKDTDGDGVEDTFVLKCVGMPISDATQQKFYDTYAEYGEDVGWAVYERLVTLSGGATLAGTGCGEEQTIAVTQPNYAIVQDPNDPTQLELYLDGDPNMLGLTNLYVHVTWMYDVPSGDSCSFTVCLPCTPAEKDANNRIRRATVTIATPHLPAGSTVTAIFVKAVNSGSYSSLAANEVTNFYGYADLQ